MNMPISFTTPFGREFQSDRQPDCDAQNTEGAYFATLLIPIPVAEVIPDSPTLPSADAGTIDSSPVESVVPVRPEVLDEKKLASVLPIRPEFGSPTTKIAAMSIEAPTLSVSGVMINGENTPTLTPDTAEPVAIRTSKIPSENLTATFQSHDLIPFGRLMHDSAFEQSAIFPTISKAFDVSNNGQTPALPQNPIVISSQPVNEKADSQAINSYSDHFEASSQRKTVASNQVEVTADYSSPSFPSITGLTHGSSPKNHVLPILNLSESVDSVTDLDVSRLSPLDNKYLTLPRDTQTSLPEIHKAVSLLPLSTSTNEQVDGEMTSNAVGQIHVTSKSGSLSLIDFAPKTVFENAAANPSEIGSADSSPNDTPSSIPVAIRLDRPQRELETLAVQSQPKHSFIERPQLTDIPVNQTTSRVSSFELLGQIKPEIIGLAASVRPESEQQSLKMLLHPAELGMVEITLVRHESGSMSADIVSESETAYAILTENVAELKEALESAGLHIEKLEVGHRSSSSPGQRENHGGTAHGQAAFHQPDAVSDLGGISEITDEGPTRLVSLRA